MVVRPAPDPARSINAQDYQHRPRVVTAMAKEFPAGAQTGSHSHPRAQLIYAIEGVMRVTTPSGFWALPPLRALWVPAGVPLRPLRSPCVRSTSRPKRPRATGPSAR